MASNGTLNPLYSAPAYIDSVPTAGGVLGAWLVSLILITYFVGLQSTQTVKYYTTFQNDPMPLKVLVGVLGVLAGLQWTVSFAGAWLWFVQRYGENITSFPWAVGAEPIASQLGIFAAQLFFAHRCYHLAGRSKILLFGILGAMLTTLGISAYIAFCLIDPSHDPMALVKARTVSIPCQTLNLATDLTVTACTTWALYKSSKSGINPNTQTVLRRMIATIWEAAAPPVVAVALSSAFRQTLGSVNIVYVLFNMLATRLYAFSLLYTLNSRIDIRTSMLEVNQPDILPLDGGGKGKNRNLIIARTATPIIFADTGMRTTTITSSALGITTRLSIETV